MTVSVSDIPLNREIDRPRIGLAVVIWLCLLSALAGRLVYITRPFNSDASMFIYMGKVINEGGRVGRDFIDNKFPTVGLMTGVAWRAFGSNWVSYVLTQTAMMLVAVGMLARAMRRHAGENAAIASGCFALVMLNFTTIVFGGFQLETLQGFFAILGAAAALDSIDDGGAADALVVGLCAGCAAMMKPTGLAVAGAFVLALVLMRALRIRQVLALMLGLCVPASAVFAYLLMSDTVRDVPELFRHIARYAGESAWEIGDVYKLLLVGAVVLFPFLVRAWVSRRDRLPMKSSGGVRTFIACWLVLELAGVIMQRRMYPFHFLVLIPPSAMAFGLIPRITRARALAAALAPAAALSLLAAYRIVDWNYTQQKPHPVSAYLLAHTRPTDAIWREDGARVLLETNLRPGSRLPLTFLFTNSDDAPRQFGQMILTDFTQTRPHYIVLFTHFDDWLAHQCDYYTELRRRPVRRENYLHAWRDIRQYVAANYQVEAQVGEETIYRRVHESNANDR